jgi:hypothetical protein
MALNVAPVPISSEVEDLPVIYSLAAPARSEADDLRDALHHEEFLHDQGYFSNVALNSAQAFVTGYHADGQGNRYTAITGLRSVRTAYTGNGPQTVYGHYTARLYTDLDPIPSSVVIPTFLQPTNPDDTYWVSRNGDPHVWPDTDRCAEWIDYQPPASGPGTDLTREQPTVPEGEHNPPPTYTPATLPTPTQVSRSDSESSTDDENWLPCVRCAQTHGDFGCVAGSQYSLVRVSSNGSVSSSVHLLDEPIKIECYVGTRAEFHTLNASSGSEGSDPLITRTPSRIIDSHNTRDVSEYNAHRYPQIRPGRDPPHSLNISTSHSLPSSPISEPPPLISLSESDDEQDDGKDTTEMQHGVVSLWNEFKKGLTEEQLGRYWGRTPYQIIMGLGEVEVERLAKAAVATEITLARLAAVRTSMVPSSHLALSDVRRQLHQVLRPTLVDRTSPVESPIELTAQEARGLATHHRIVPCMGNITGKRRNSIDSSTAPNRQLLSIPETFPFTYTPDYSVRPAECSPIAVPEPMAVYTARVAKPFAVDDTYRGPLRTARSFDDEHPDRNKFRVFLKSPAVWPTVPPLSVFASTSHTSDLPHASDSQPAQAWDIGAEPMSPNSEPVSPVEPPPRVHNLPRQHTIYQEMDPVLRPSEERDIPPPETAAKQHDRARIQEHLNNIREESALMRPPSISYPSLFHEVLVHGDRRPLPTRPNTPETSPQQSLTGEGFAQALSNIAAEAENFSMRVAELETEKAEEELQAHFMHSTGNTYEHTRIKSETRDPRLPAKASLRKNI